ncbi:MAG: hypothetical protein H6661_10190 [Ardenticatenaceae bacterium]|nr:hypothetical protein [Ardenticatenaceae bacterium]
MSENGAPVGWSTMAVLRAIVEFKLAHDGASPAVRELARMCNLASTSTIDYHLGRLEEAGLIERPPGLARVIRVVGGEWRPPEGLRA